MNVTHEIVLDVNIDTLETINIKQYTKNSHILHIRLTENGIDYPIDSNTVKCQFKMLTPNKNYILTDAVINNDGTITVTLPEAACLAPGNGTAELLFVQPKNSDTDYDYILLSMTFNINIIKSVYNHDDIVPYDDFDALNQALIKVNKDYEYVMASAQKSADDAEVSRNAAQTFANNAEQSKNNASNSATNAQSAAGNAANSAKNALQYSNNADSSKNIAHQKANAAANSATEAKSYAVGNTNTRPNENTENAKFYYTESKKYYDSLSQAGKVTGIKGSSESSYRTGNVELTAANIGLGNVDNTADKNKVVRGLKTEAGTDNVDRRVYFANTNASNTEARLVYDDDFKYNPATNTLKIGNIDGTAAYAKNLKVQQDNWKQSTDLPSTYPQGATVFFSNNPTNKFNGISYCTIHTIKGYSNMACIQFLYPYNTNHDKFYFREALYNTDSWRPWYEVITSANIGSQSVSYATNAGSATSATKATQDGNGNNIVSTYLSKTDASSTYLPLAGGTITGNLRLKGSGDYGNKLNFGDRDLVYLHEDTDDHLRIFASAGISLNGNGHTISVDGNKVMTHKTITFSTTGTSTLNFTSNAYNNSSELYIYLFSPQINSLRSCYSWTVDKQTLGDMGTLRLIDGYKVGSYEGSAEVEINTSYARLIRMNVGNVNYDSTATLRVVFR